MKPENLFTRGISWTCNFCPGLDPLKSGNENFAWSPLKLTIYKSRKGGCYFRCYGLNQIVASFFVKCLNCGCQEDDLQLWERFEKCESSWPDSKPIKVWRLILHVTRKEWREVALGQFKSFACLGVVKTDQQLIYMLRQWIGNDPFKNG